MFFYKSSLIWFSNDALRTAQLIPVNEPYTALGYKHIGGGGESVNPSVFTDAIVDWVFLELNN